MGISLLTNPSYVQAPIIQVSIGDYKFGVYDEKAIGTTKYPNYIQSLEVEKVNGKINTYSLHIVYPITETTDPNYFEKIFSSVSESRKIVFTYGDASSENSVYRNEEAMITNISSTFSSKGSVLTYTVSAIGWGALSATGYYSFGRRLSEKPSVVIEELLTNPYYGLQDLFTGMRDMSLVRAQGLIPGNDVCVLIEKRDNISPLAYLEYLVSLMTPNKIDSSKKSVFILTFQDDTMEIFGGPYFKIKEVDSSIDHPEAYEIVIGYPEGNFVTEFNVNQSESYSIYYKYQNKIHPQDTVQRINEDGVVQEVYAPLISSNNERRYTSEFEKSWWAKMVQFPIRASVKLRGLLRPAVLMSYVRVNIYFYGQKHIYSGLYIITKQTDSVSGNGYSTQLDLLRIGGDT